MPLDGRRQHGKTFETDLCIIGAGAAGITMARQFAGSQLRVVVLESGGQAADPATQELSAGTLDGPIHRPDYLTTSRVRGFGGTTQTWTGTCRPLDPIDFEQRSWVPDSGWPITRAELDPYYLRAADILEIQPFDRETVDGQLLPHEEFGDERASASNDERFVPKVLHVSPPTRFAERYGPELLAAPNIKVFFWSNVVEIHRSRQGEPIERVSVASLSGARFSVRARAYVLATGGIENARLLLSSRDVEGKGLGNQWDNVGRFFMDHAHLRFVGHAVWSNLSSRRQVAEKNAELSRQLGHLLYFVLSPTEAFQRREKLLNGGVRWLGIDLPKYSRQAGSEFTRQMAQWTQEFDGDGEILGGSRRELRDPFCLNRLKFYLEELPHRESRVRLGEERDALGLNRVQLDWRPSGLILQSVQRYLELFAREMGRAGRGRVQIVLDEKTAFARYGEPHNHHMGTTRMHANPRHGVVDADCRMHGVSNLWIAGSSVFPTAGFANPTMTLVALALRLSDHLQGWFNK